MRDGVVAGAVDVVSAAAAAATPNLPVFDDDTEALPRDDDVGVDNIIKEDVNLFRFLFGEFELDVEVGGSGGGGVLLGTAGAPTSSAVAASKNSNDERQCLIFFLDRADDEEADIVASSAVGEEDAAG